MVTSPVEWQMESAAPGTPTEVSAAVGIAPDILPRLEAIYREHQAFVWRNARRLGADETWVDDATHEVFLVVARRLADFRGESSMRTWLFAITYRVVKAMARGLRGRALIPVAEGMEWAGDSGGDERATAELTLRRMLAALPEPQRLVFILCELEGMSSAESGRLLGIPTGTIDTRLRAARQALTDMAGRVLARERRVMP